MLLGLDMVDWVDQSFVKVHFHKMTVEYSNWLVDKIVDRKTGMVSMREQFLGDGKSKQEDDNYEFKRRDRDDRSVATNGTSDQSQKKNLKNIQFFYFLFFLWTCLFKKFVWNLLALGII